MISGLIVAFLMLWHMQSPKTFPPTTLRRRSTVCDWLDQSVKSGEGDTPSQTHTVREVCCSKNRRYKHVAAVPTY
jgi:hypothetical protein